MKKALFALLAIALLVLVACAPKEPAPEPAPAPVPEPEPAPAPVVIEPPVQEKTGLLVPLSSISCVGDTIIATVTNVGDEEWVIGENAKIYLNAGIDKEPGCEKTTLAPGESTVCDGIDWPIVQKAGKKNILQIVAAGERYAFEEVYCTESAAE
ncbi:MAG: hypothetical protein KAT77_00970 [Nanoarchaeota archaeon]|nr:hypothetical protein [Nanoarchaeota archaeon]